LAVIFDSGGGESSSTVDVEKSNGFGMYDNWTREPMVLSSGNTMLCKDTDAAQAFILSRTEFWWRKILHDKIWRIIKPVNHIPKTKT
jgi:hypothetical protein